LCQTPDGDIAKILDFGSVKDKADNAKKLTVMGTTIGSPYYMAPEQAQGLDTLDHRADVWALGAIAYEALTGQVPFNGPTGPAILLQILTKEPDPPSEVGKGKRYPVPPTLDRVLANAFKKNASVRTESVGKLADAVGAAYGLTGTHADWAQLPEQELARQIDAKLPELMRAPVPAEGADASQDFFGEQDALGAMDQAFAASNAAAPPAAGGPPASTYDDIPGLPTRSAGWVLPVAIGGSVLVISVVVAAWLLF
ncbi:MAG TPA: protein kinase, partial [Polyangiaceae bacterium]